MFFKKSNTVGAKLRVFRLLHSTGLGYLFVLPALLAVLFVNAYPVVRGIWRSFFSQNLLSPWKGTPFIGLSNYVNLLHDKIFLAAAWQNIYWVVTIVLLQYAIGLPVALLLNKRLKGIAFFKTLIIIPWVVPSAVVAIMGSTILTSTGSLNRILIQLGLIEEYFPWLSNYRTAMLCLIAFSVWKGMPFFAIMLLAGLKSIPPQLYEAAALDGANKWQVFRHVTLPLLKNLSAICIMLESIWTFKWIDLIFIMTEGGPGTSTYILSLYAYTSAFRRGLLGYGSAIAVTVLPVVLVLTIIYAKLLRYRS